MSVSPEFTLDIIAAPDEIDELNHVSNIVYVRWILRAAQAHSDAVGYTWPEYQRIGAVFVVRRHEVDYLRPAFADDPIRLITWVDSWKGASCVRRTSIRSQDDTEIARANTLWAMVKLDTGRPTRIPLELKQRFANPPGV